jgi:predicted nuclease with TOPRIM domain
LAEVEAKIEELWAAAMASNDDAKKAIATATIAETTAKNTAQVAAQEKAALESKVTELEHDLGAARADLRMANRQFSEVANKLQDATDEATRLRDANSKLTQNVDGKRALNASSCDFLSFH